MMYEWLLFAIMEGGSTVPLTPDEPFIGTFWDAGEEADRLINDIGGVEELVYERRGAARVEDEEE